MTNSTEYEQTQTAFAVESVKSCVNHFVQSIQDKLSSCKLRSSAVLVQKNRDHLIKFANINL